MSRYPLLVKDGHTMVIRPLVSKALLVVLDWAPKGVSPSVVGKVLTPNFPPDLPETDRHVYFQSFCNYIYQSKLSQGWCEHDSPKTPAN